MTEQQLDALYKRFKEGVFGEQRFGQVLINMGFFPPQRELFFCKDDEISFSYAKDVISRKLVVNTAQVLSADEEQMKVAFTIVGKEQVAAFRRLMDLIDKGTFPEHLTEVFQLARKSLVK